MARAGAAGLSSSSDAARWGDEAGIGARQAAGQTAAAAAPEVVEPLSARGSVAPSQPSAASGGRSEGASQDGAVQAPELVSIGVQSWRNPQLRQRSENASRGSVESAGKLAERVRLCDLRACVTATRGSLFEHAVRAAGSC